jgi:hypothetical protein
MTDDIYAEADAIEERYAALAEAHKDFDEVLADIQVRLEALEAHFTTQGLNELAQAIEQRIVARMQQNATPRAPHGIDHAKSDH